MSSRDRGETEKIEERLMGLAGERETFKISSAPAIGLGGWGSCVCVCLCVFLYLLHLEYQNSHSFWLVLTTSKDLG